MTKIETRCDFCDALPCLTGDEVYTIQHYYPSGGRISYDICVKCWKEYIEKPTYKIYKQRGLMEGFKMATVKPHTGIRCVHCKDEIFSEYRHDWHQCKCGKVFVDGGYDYFRTGGACNTDWVTVYRGKDGAVSEEPPPREGG